MPRPCATRGESIRARPAEHLDRAGIGRDQAGEQLDDGRLAGAVLAEQGVHPAGFDRERDAVDGDGRAEGLAEDRGRRSPRAVGCGRLHGGELRPLPRQLFARTHAGTAGSAVPAASPIEVSKPIARADRRGRPEKPISGVSSEKIEANQPGFGDDRRLEGVAAGLHLLPGAFLAELDRLVGDDRQRQDGQLRHVLAVELLDRQLQRQPAGIGRRGVGDARRAHRRDRVPLAPSTSVPAGSIWMRWPLAPSPAQGFICSRLLAGLDLHRRRGVAADLHPQAVDLVPVVGGEDLRQLGARDRLAPHADRFGDDLDVRISWRRLPWPPAVRCVSTEVPGTPVRTTMLPLPFSFLTSHSAVTRPASC